MQLTIACLREGGMLRGGVRHGRVAEHLVTAFTPDQLREMVAERDLVVVVGRPLTTVDIARIEEERRAADKAARREKNTLAATSAAEGTAGAAEKAAPAALAAKGRKGKAA
jgi:hypothetical protein